MQQQCELLGVPRSTYYYQPRPESAENLRLLRRLDELYLDCPFFGSRKMAVALEVNRKRIQRLMRILGIEALYPKPHLSRPAEGHKIYPYLLRGVSIEGRSFGDTRLTATTKGDTITAVFESTAANVRVRGDATLQLAGDYPVAATVRFNDTTISALAAIALKPETARNLSVDGVAEAEVKITGPARHPESIRAEVNVGKLEFRAASGTDVAKPTTLPPLQRHPPA